MHLLDRAVDSSMSRKFLTWRALDQFTHRVMRIGQRDLHRLGSPRTSASASFNACDALIFAGIGGVNSSTTASISTAPDG